MIKSMATVFSNVINLYFKHDSDATPLSGTRSIHAHTLRLRYGECEQVRKLRTAAGE